MGMIGWDRETTHGMKYDMCGSSLQRSSQGARVAKHGPQFWPLSASWHAIKLTSEPRWERFVNASSQQSTKLITLTLSKCLGTYPPPTHPHPPYHMLQEGTKWDSPKFLVSLDSLSLSINPPNGSPTKTLLPLKACGFCRD